MRVQLAPPLPRFVTRREAEKDGRNAGPLKDEPGGVEKIQKIGRDFLQQSLKRGIDSIMGVTAKNAAYGRPQVEARSNFGRRRGRI